MAQSKATRPATDLVNEPRAIDPAGRLGRRDATKNSARKQDASRRLDRATAHWSPASPSTAIAAAFMAALKRRAGWS
jgi:hypothetical protein